MESITNQKPKKPSLQTAIKSKDDDTRKRSPTEGRKMLKIIDTYKFNIKLNFWIWGSEFEFEEVEFKDLDLKSCVYSQPGAY